MFDFLEDANEQATLLAVKKRLRTDRDALLSECETKASSADAAALKATLKRLDTDVVNHLTQLARQARQCAETLPMPRGVFVKEDDRARAYTHLLNTLPTMHRSTQTLNASIANFLQFEQIAAKRRQNALAAEVLIGATLLAMKECSDDSSHCVSSIYDQLKLENRRADELTAIASSHTALLLAFSKNTLVAFFVRIEQVADLQNHGRAADPSSIVNLTNRLAREADLLIDEILLSQANASSFQ